MSSAETATYDIIFAGGGATACVTAGRLAVADPSLKILILEAGPHTRELHEHVQPGRYFSNLLLPREVFSFHFGKGTKATNERLHLVPAGRAVGGGSSVNFVMYMRPAPSDYDDWENVHGNKGWSSKELIPLLNKAETYQADPKSKAHGHSGPLKVSYAGVHNNVGKEVLAIAKVLEKEHGETSDLNDMTTNSTNKWGGIQRFVDEETGRRSDTAHHYIYNQDAINKNLTLLTRKKVAKIIFEGKRAVGVEYVDDTVGRSKGITEPIIARASKLVVLSAGAFGTTSILERSGIGAKSVLEKNGVKPFVDLPGVGEGYMDHNILFVPFHASDETESMDTVFRGSKEELEPHAQLWLKEGKGYLSNNGIDAGIKLRPSEAELRTMPEFSQRWASYYANAPDKPVMLMATMAAYVGLNPAVPRGTYYSMAYFSAHPASTGHVHITSGTDLYAPLDFVPGYLNEPADVGILRWAYKRAREVGRRLKFFRGELQAGHPQFSKDSKAAVGHLTHPVDVDSSPVEYTAEDDAAIDEFHRENVETSWHACGTCSMKPRENGGVVDSKLNVYGVDNLKIADISIMPGNVSANTYSTAIAVGEKAAIIIAEELGIKGISPA